MPKRVSKPSKPLSTARQLTTFFSHPQETLILCVVSALDVVMTFRLLNRWDISFTESNPFARYFLDRWGLAGMAYFKATMTIFVCVITQIIARKNPALARRVIGLATVIIIGVVIYSVWLHIKHREIIEVDNAGCWRKVFCILSPRDEFINEANLCLPREYFHA